MPRAGLSPTAVVDVAVAVVDEGGPRALLRAYRDYAVEHPHRYATLPQSPRETPGWDTAGRRLMDTIFAVLTGCGVTGAEAVHFTRCIRAAGHGFATLESQGGFQLAEDIETSFATLTRMVLSALPSR
ncbi:TetR-like C-terminal domain-containing protein [Nocardia sp. NPDC004568]|uniref:TetR-like C-terminal domain-containing protein n=1 Tax=Nocardia sp. NPDC004568 TaxID=3154551 RepID=UPI0033B30110